MEIRNNKQVTDIIDYVLDRWDLTVNEEELLDSVLLTFSAQNIEKQKQLAHLLNDETEELLETLDNYSVQRYAINTFDLIDEDDCEECDDCVALEDYDDDEILYECDRRDLSLHVGGRIDIITESQLEEMTDLFLSADFNKRNEILKQLNNGK